MPNHAVKTVRKGRQIRAEDTFDGAELPKQVLRIWFEYLKRGRGEWAEPNRLIRPKRGEEFGGWFERCSDKELFNRVDLPVLIWDGGDAVDIADEVREGRREIGSFAVMELDLRVSKDQLLKHIKLKLDLLLPYSRGRGRSSRYAIESALCAYVPNAFVDVLALQKALAVYDVYDKHAKTGQARPSNATIWDCEIAPRLKRPADRAAGRRFDDMIANKTPRTKGAEVSRYYKRAEELTRAVVRGRFPDPRRPAAGNQFSGWTDPDWN